MNLGEMTTEFSDLLNRRDATTGQKASWMRQGLERIQRELRIPAMQKAVTLEASDTNYDPDNPGLVIPSDLIELDSITVTDEAGEEHELTRKTLNVVLSSARVTGVPEVFQRRAGKWVLGPYPQGGTPIRIDYFAEYAGLEEDTDENIVSIICPTLAIYAALTYAGTHFKDKRVSEWEARYKQILDELHDQADQDELSGGAAVSAPFDWPCDD